MPRPRKIATVKSKGAEPPVVVAAPASIPSEFVAQAIDVDMRACTLLAIDACGRRVVLKFTRNLLPRFKRGW